MKHSFMRLIGWWAALGFGLGAASQAEDVEPSAVVGKGDAPEKVYRLFYQAKKRLDTLGVSHLASRRSTYGKDGLYERLMRERSTLPDSIELVLTQSEEGVAQALFTGIRLDPETDKAVTSRGTVQFLLEDGAWRVYQEKWVDVKEDSYLPSEPGASRNLHPTIPKESKLPRKTKKPASDGSKGQATD